MTFAIIETGGKQYKVGVGKKIQIEKLPFEAGKTFRFDRVLLKFDGKETVFGQPYIPGAVIEGEILRQARGKKKIVFKYHSKTRYRKKKGHRQDFTEVEVTKM
ncbi:50S ribosomal protein L21 [Candidatus Jorgensenbacteria bacterium RIFCSPLOWO2_01_FULL_45_25b]|uniref:Large ribosomal subunit protein bL21 n=1 Tax=Candidatus Jorgensenbacteria bacterium RIFCSPLOWO2_01_FULL_45_25b TaxID=1798471 RepID=A0A1F6BZ37_9BACT|nr:MAG: 50S ribosomal protein L21 [Candidatus Jorgensenbacteria bacterium RIFCSPLOWO2_01_FULL_45_25b]